MGVQVEVGRGFGSSGKFEQKIGVWLMAITAMSFGEVALGECGSWEEKGGLAREPIPQFKGRGERERAHEAKKEVRDGKAPGAYVGMETPGMCSISRKE